MVNTTFKYKRQLREHIRYQGFLMIKELYNQTMDSIDKKTTIMKLQQLNGGFMTRVKNIKVMCGMVVRSKNYYERLWNQRYCEIIKKI